jgi:hypothetical protein
MSQTDDDVAGDQSEADEGRRWASPPKPTSPEVAAAYLEISQGEAFSEPSGTVAEARRGGEVIPEEEA